MCKKQFTCMPRILTTSEQKISCENAVKINPHNGPSMRGLKSFISEYSPKSSDIAALAAATTKLWSPAGVHLTVGFLDSASGELRNKILGHMNAWGQGSANVEFAETNDVESADVLINRERSADPSWGGYWSYLGTDIHLYQGPYGQTMNLEGFTFATLDSEFLRVVRHEAGHALGYEHEHMRQELVTLIDRQKAFDYFEQYAGWSEQTVIDQVLTPLSDNDITNTPFADPTSIMAYQIPGNITKSGNPIEGGRDINQLDREFNGLIYPMSA